MEVEHLWTYNEGSFESPSPSGSSLNHMGGAKEIAKSRLMAENSGTDFLSNLCNIADHRLYKIVKWCKSLPLFKNISVIFFYYYSYNLNDYHFLSFFNRLMIRYPC